jgi:hypothetical protein
MKTTAAAPALTSPLVQSMPANPIANVKKLFVYVGEYDRGFIKYTAAFTGKDNPRI